MSAADFYGYGDERGGYKALPAAEAMVRNNSATLAWIAGAAPAFTAKDHHFAPGQSISETLGVDDVMIVLEGRLSVSTDAGTVSAGPGEIVYMPKGKAVTIRSQEEGALTAYVTYPHWREAHA